MADKVGIKISVDTKSGAVSLDKLENSFEQLDNQVKKNNSRLKTFGSSLFSFKGALAGLGIGLATKKLADMTLAQFKLQDETIKTSREIGVQVGSLISLRRSAELGGASVESLDTGMKRLSRNIYDVSQGTGEARKAFDEMGISVEDNNGNLRSSEEILLQVADNFAKMEDGTRKNAQAQLLFGRSGADLINTLNQGSEAIIRQRKEAEKLGIVFDEQTGKNAEELNDALGDLERSFQGAFQQITNDLAPRLTPLIKDLTETISNNKDDIKEWGQGLFDAFNLALPIIKSVGSEIKNTLNFWSDFFERASNTQRLEEISDLADRYIFIKKQLKDMTPLAEKFKQAGVDNSVVQQVESYKNELIELEQQLARLRKQSKVKTQEETQDSTNESKAIRNEEFRTQEEEKEIESLRRITESQRDFALKQWGIKKDFEKRMALLSKQRAEQEIKNTLDVASVVNQSLRDIFGENKAFASADIIINTARGIQKSFADLPPPLNFIQAGAIGASGAVQLAKVNGAKFADGGFVSGSGTNRSDSIPARLSDGEFVVNARATADNRELLEAINSGQRGGSSISINVTAGMGANGNEIAQTIVNELRRAEILGLEPQVV